MDNSLLPRMSPPVERKLPTAAPHKIGNAAAIVAAARHCTPGDEHKDDEFSYFCDSPGVWWPTHCIGFDKFKTEMEEGERIPFDQDAMMFCNGCGNDKLCLIYEDLSIETFSESKDSAEVARAIRGR